MANGGTEGRSQEVSRHGIMGRMSTRQSGCLEVHEKVQHQGHNPVREGLLGPTALDGPASEFRRLYTGSGYGLSEVWLEKIGGTWYAVTTAGHVSALSVPEMLGLESR